MKRNTFLRTVVVTFVSLLMFSANANSVSFDMGEYGPDSVSNGQLSVSINYDFTDFPMFGGGFNVLFDPTVIEFVSYTQAPLPDDAQAPASPVGALTADGVYSGAGIGTFDFINGMNSAGQVGTFVFNVLFYSGGDAGCGLVLCLQANAINPLVSLAGADVTADLLGDGAAMFIPVPAAVWFLLSGLGVLLGIGRNTA